MYYLVIEIMGVKKCIDINEKNIYKDDQLYDCLHSLPFREEGKSIVSVVLIRCISSPGISRKAVVFSD